MTPTQGLTVHTDQHLLLSNTGTADKPSMPSYVMTCMPNPPGPDVGTHNARLVMAAEDKQAQLCTIHTAHFWNCFTAHSLLKTLAPVVCHSLPVVGVRDHAVAVEHSTDVLLWPVAIGQLAVHQEAHASLNWLPALLVVACCYECAHSPACVDHMRSISL